MSYTYPSTFNKLNYLSIEVLKQQKEAHVIQILLLHSTTLLHKSPGNETKELVQTKLVNKGNFNAVNSTFTKLYFTFLLWMNVEN